MTLDQIVITIGLIAFVPLFAVYWYGLSRSKKRIRRTGDSESTNS